MKIDLSGKLALVTAGSRGIGFGIAQALRGAGARVSICARTEADIAKAAKALEHGDAASVHARTGDIGDPSFLRVLVDDCTKRFGAGVDILVNNNGGPPAGDTFGFSDEQWQGALSRNLMSTVRLSQLVVPSMIKKHWGRIINLASTTGKEPDAGMVLSNVTRAAVAAYSKTLSRELGPHGITVNTVLTGGCMTERLRSLIQGEIEGTDETIEAAIARSAKMLPVQYFPTPAEFAQTVLFLASTESAFLTGVALPLDGGYTHGTF